MEILDSGLFLGKRPLCAYEQIGPSVRSPTTTNRVDYPMPPDTTHFVLKATSAQGKMKQKPPFLSVCAGTARQTAIDSTLASQRSWCQSSQ